MVLQNIMEFDKEEIDNNIREGEIVNKKYE